MAGRLIKKKNIALDSGKKKMLSASLFSGVIEEMRSGKDRRKREKDKAPSPDKSEEIQNRPHLPVEQDVLKSADMSDSSSETSSETVYGLDAVKKKIGTDASVTELRNELIGNLRKETIRKQSQLELLTDEVATLKTEYADLLKKKEIISEDVLKKASEAAEASIKEAKTNGEEYLTKARAEADELIESAKVEVANLKKVALDDLEKKEVETKRLITEEISERVWQEGKEEIFRLKNLLEHITKETISKRNEIIEASHKHLVDISLTIAKKVIKKNRKEDGELVVRTINSALKKVGSVVRLTIRINPEDWDVSNKFYEVFKKIVDSVEEMEMIKDPTLSRGDCVIESDLGIIDARLESQLGEIENAIEEVETLKSR